MIVFSNRITAIGLCVLAIGLGFQVVNAGKQTVSIRNTKNYQEYVQAKQKGMGSLHNHKDQSSKVKKPTKPEAMTPAEIQELLKKYNPKKYSKI